MTCRHTWKYAWVGNHRDIPGRECQKCGKKEKLEEPRPSSESIISEIELARSKNNVNWMDILRIAMKHAPDETREVLRKIQEYDAAIAMILGSLAQ